MDAGRPHSGPDPARVHTLDDLARELGLLRSRAARGTRSPRVSLETLAARLGEPRSTIHAYVAGRRLPPAQLLDRIVIALGTSAIEQREWAEAWDRVDAHRWAAHRVPGLGPPRDSVPHQTPSTVDAFTGRTTELRQLDELLDQVASGTIAAIRGTAGIGKTGLAVQWAQARSDRFPDGQLYLDLRGFDPVQPMQPGQALARLLRALGVGAGAIPRETDERAAMYRSLLSGRRMLIVLDNARDTEQVRALLPGAATCVLVTTSRDSLTGLVVRHGAHGIDLDALPLSDATELLRSLIRSQPAAGSRRPAHRDLVALAERCARIPLALRIAAELAVAHPATPLSALVDELAAGHGELDLLEAGGDPRTALRSVFSWSYRSLPRRTARAFRLIGLHSDVDLTPAAMAAIIGTDLHEATSVLAQLTQVHLTHEERPGHYGMNSLLRAYAAELSVTVDGDAERGAALARLSEQQRRSPADPRVVGLAAS